MKFYLKKLSLLAASFAAVAMIAPNLAYAHGGSYGGDDSDRDGREGLVRELSDDFRDHVDLNKEDNDEQEGADEDSDSNENEFNREDRGERGVKRGHGLAPAASLFYSGTVTAVSDSGFTFTAHNDVVLDVDTSDAKLVRIPRSVIVLADIQVGDRVFVTGTKEGSTVTASVVYAQPANLKHALAKGTVTAISGSTLTVQSKKGASATVTADSETQITKDGELAAFADIGIGSRVKIFGLWDQILHVFTALKIAIK